MGNSRHDGWVNLRHISLFSCLGLLLGALLPSSAAEPLVLVYTRNHTPDGKGFVHSNIASSVAMLKELAAENQFHIETSDDPSLFTPETLKKYRALVFSNTNNEAFENDAQREAFRKFIQSGGGFAGIHSASGSERTWPYFWAVVGGKFSRHAPGQKFRVRVIDARHPATSHLVDGWERDDEFYYLDHLNPRLHVLLAGELTGLKDPGKDKYPGKVFGEVFPLSWCQEFDGGRQFYTALGHKEEHYQDPAFRRHVLGGLLWVLGR